MRNGSTIRALLALALASLGLLACGAAAQNPSGPANPPANGTVSSPPEGVVEGSPGSEEGNSGSGTPPANNNPDNKPIECKLPAPVKSDDACTKDADCAPSVPCHARACVAVAKATPRKPDTMCTMNIDCQSADVNQCSCYEGHCALVPKGP